MNTGYPSGGMRSMPDVIPSGAKQSQAEDEDLMEEQIARDAAFAIDSLSKSSSEDSYEDYD